MNYFSDTHHSLRDLVRDFVAREIAPHLEQWEEQESFPIELYKKAAERGRFETNMLT